MDHLLHVIHNLHYSLPQLEKVHTIAGTTQRSRAQIHPPTTPCAVDALLQHSTRALTSCELHREQWRAGTATVGGERRVVSDNAATDGGRWSAHSDDVSRGEYWRRVSGQVQFLVVGETRRADTTMWWQRSGLVGGTVWPNGAVGCRILDGVAVVVVGERSVDLLER